MTRIIAPIFILLGAVALTALLLFLRPKPESEPRTREPVPVEYTVAHAADNRVSIRSQGMLEPRLQATLAAEVGGRVIETAPGFVQGGFVEEGEALVHLDPTNYEVALEEAEAGRLSSQTSLAQAEADAEQAILDLRDVGVENPTPLARREPQLTQARAALDSAEANVRLARKNLERTVIRAPFSGQLREVSVEVGDVLAGNGTPVATLFGTDLAEIRLPLARSDLALLALPETPSEIAAAAETKPRVHLRWSNSPEDQFRTGWIDRLEGTVDPASRLRYAVARIEDPLGTADLGATTFPVGAFLIAEIEGVLLKDSFRLPASALVGRDWILVIDDDNRLTERKVEVAFRNNGEVLLTGGLADGDRICLTPLDLHTPNMEVRPQGDREEWLYEQLKLFIHFILNSFTSDPHGLESSSNDPRSSEGYSSSMAHPTRE